MSAQIASKRGVFSWISIISGRPYRAVQKGIEEKKGNPRRVIKYCVPRIIPRISLDFFKHYAKQHHIKYQKMIRQLIDKYVKQYSKV